MPDIPAQNGLAPGNQCPDKVESCIDEPRTGTGNKQGGTWPADRLCNVFPLKHSACGLHVSSNTLYRGKGLEDTSRGHLVQPHFLKKNLLLFCYSWQILSRLWHFHHWRSLCTTSSTNLLLCLYHKEIALNVCPVYSSLNFKWCVLPHSRKLHLLYICALLFWFSKTLV